jgi:SulP family sulfate permease
LAAILMIVAWNMSEIKHVREIMRSPRSDRIVLLVTFLLTVLVDLNFAIQAGIALASILFIDQMMKSTQIRAVESEEDDPDSIHNKTIPEGVEVYEIDGPLFFGVAEKLVDTLLLFEKPPIIFILRMRHVPLIDAAGLHALEVLHERLHHNNTRLILSGVNPQVRRFIGTSHIDDKIGQENIVDHIDKAIKIANEVIGEKN